LSTLILWFVIIAVATTVLAVVVIIAVMNFLSYTSYDGGSRTEMPSFLRQEENWEYSPEEREVGREFFMEEIVNAVCKTSLSNKEGEQARLFIASIIDRIIMIKEAPILELNVNKLIIGMKPTQKCPHFNEEIRISILIKEEDYSEIALKIDFPREDIKTLFERERLVTNWGYITVKVIIIDFKGATKFMWGYDKPPQVTAKIVEVVEGKAFYEPLK